MKLGKEQIEILSDYFSDISKLIAASAVVGFFIPTQETRISPAIAIAGLLTAIGFIITAVAIQKRKT